MSFHFVGVVDFGCGFRASNIHFFASFIRSFSVFLFVCLCHCLIRPFHSCFISFDVLFPFQNEISNAWNLWLEDGFVAILDLPSHKYHSFSFFYFSIICTTSFFLIDSKLEKRTRAHAHDRMLHSVIETYFYLQRNIISRSRYKCYTCVCL